MQLGSLVLGGNVFGWTTARDEAFVILDSFYERGGRAIDTADLYPAWAPGRQGGESEVILGEWLQTKPRSEIIICTKVAKWAEQRGLSPQNIARAIDRSLERLRTDYVDIYYAHEDDHAVPQLDYARAFDALAKAGKVRVLGASNFTPARLASAIGLQKAHGLTRFTVSQDHWNLVERSAEHDLVPLLAREDVKELPYFALASGFLTGKYRPGLDIPSERKDSGAHYLANMKNRTLLTLLDQIAAAHAVPVAAIALAWLRAQPTVAAPIASARTRAQLDALMQPVTLTHDELRALSA